jgi:hypothetical protein
MPKQKMERWLVTLAADPASDIAVPMANRIRSLLKNALRQHHLKNQEVAGDEVLWTIAFELPATVLGETLSQRVGHVVDNAWIYGLKCVKLVGLHPDGKPIQPEEIVDNSISRGIPE